MIEIKEIDKETDWRPETIIDAVPLPQTFWYGEIQKKRGRNVYRFELLKDSTTVGFVQFVEYDLALNLTYWYSSYGPIILNGDLDLFKAIDKKIHSKLDHSKVVFVRLDFTPTLSLIQNKDAESVFTKTSKISGQGSYYQPRHEWYTDISKSEKEILMAMHEKTRYSVRLAEKKGVQTKIISGLDLTTRIDNFLLILKNTGDRNNFALHDDDYYRYFFEEIVKRGNGFLVEASFADKILAMHFIVIEDKIAHYVFGGSSNEMRHLCAPYLAHFRGMLEAKVRGANFYNFGGISENGGKQEWQGITLFKKKFGGETFSHSPYFDIIIKPVLYHLYNFRKLLKTFV